MFAEKKYIKCNIWWVAVRPSYIWEARFLKVNNKWNYISEPIRLQILDGEKYYLITFTSSSY